MNESIDMNCAELADVAAELALGVLTGRERADAVAHLSRCDGCREYVRQLMETGGGLLALLPPVEPPPGFETRVLERLGIPVAATQRPGPPQQRGTDSYQAGHRRPPGPQGPPGRGDHRRNAVPRSRRLLAAGAMAIAIAGAGLGGWGLGMGIGTASRLGPGASQQVPLISAAFFTAGHQSLGQVFYYDGSPEWLYMTVDMPTGNTWVTCKVLDEDGKVSTVGKFRLNPSGYGYWGTPDPSTNQSELREARLYSENGTLLATATLG